MKIKELIKQEEDLLGELFMKFTKTPEGINKLVEALCDRQAEAITRGYKLGLDEGVKLAKGKPLVLGLK